MATNRRHGHTREGNNFIFFTLLLEIKYSTSISLLFVQLYITFVELSFVELKTVDTY